MHFICHVRASLFTDMWKQPCTNDVVLWQILNQSIQPLQCLVLLLLSLSSDVSLHQLPNSRRLPVWCIVHNKTSTVLVNSCYMSLPPIFSVTIHQSVIVINSANHHDWWQSLSDVHTGYMMIMGYFTFDLASQSPNFEVWTRRVSAKR